MPISSNKTILLDEQFFIDNDLLRLTNNSLQVKMNITVNNEVITDTLKTDRVKTNNNVLTAYKLFTDMLIKQPDENYNKINRKDIKIVF